MANGATTGDAINHAIDKASDGLAQIAHSLSSAAPQAWELAVRGAHAQGIASLIIGAVSAPLCAGAAYIAYRGAKLFGSAGYSEDGKLAAGILLAVFGVIGFLGFGASFLSAWLSADTWMRVMAPDAFLAQQVLSKALN